MSWRLAGCTFASYLAVACLQAWPLPLQLGSAFTAHPGGDTGAYIWNLWIFRHELIDHGRLPFQTDAIFALGDPADLSLHNYTVASNLIALPLLPVVGIAATFNLIYLLNVALAGFGLFLLAHRVTGRVAESWIAGVLFACSPFLVARSLVHFSLVAAAPLPFFLYWLDRAWTTGRAPAAAAAGACVAWAWASDPYYAVYTVLLGAFYAVGRLVVVERRHEALRRRWLAIGLNVAIGLAAIVVLATLAGGGLTRLGPWRLSIHSLYTPMLVLTVLVVVRTLVALRPHARVRTPVALRSHLRIVAVAMASATLLLAPELLAVGRRIADGRLEQTTVLWRSSPAGVDVVSFLAPNPNHPLAPASLVSWLDSRPGYFPEQVASLPLVGFAILVIAWRRGFRPGSFWVVVTATSALLALGPFIHVAGINTYVPGPWALARYLPIIEAARMPPRFSIVATMGFAVLVAAALSWLTSRHPAQRRRWLVASGLLLAFELLPIPRTLHSAEVPAVYQRIARDPSPARVLTLPTGIRDGLSSIGDFSAAQLYYQTTHGKPIVGGYLSRVSPQRKADALADPVMRALLLLSEGRPLPAGLLDEARAGAAGFRRRAALGYVVIESSRATAELRQFAIEVLDLVPVDQVDGFELYVPRTT